MRGGRRGEEVRFGFVKGGEFVFFSFVVEAGFGGTTMQSVRKVMDVLQQTMAVTLFGGFVSATVVTFFLAGEGVGTIRTRRAEGKKIERIRQEAEASTVNEDGATEKEEDKET